MHLPKILIIELGSQYTLLIERSLRELGFRSVILDPERAAKFLCRHQPKAIILSGGAASVYNENAPEPPPGILDRPIAILGICYGMQWLAKKLRGEVAAGRGEYGEAAIRLSGKLEGLFAETPEYQKVWMSHGDSVTVPPRGFRVLAQTENNHIAAMQKGAVCGVQFHPEVPHTDHGKTFLANFLRLARCEPDWKPASIIQTIREDTLGKLGGQRAIFGFSGGVDSTTVSAILALVLKDRLLAVTIDGGHLRHGELEEIRKHARAAKVNLEIIDAKAEFCRALAGVTDAEKKRRCFKQVYRSCLIQAAKCFGAKVILQGTLGPDRIESRATGGAVIKSHHNVGLDFGDLEQLHPVDHLFKYEVRALAREMKLPRSVWNRQPFPGPGLFLRVVGVPATAEKLDLVRWADARVREILTRRRIYHKLSQLVVGYIGVPTVGVKGDGRVYAGAIVVRAIDTTDFMTAKGIHFSKAVEKEISGVLTSHPQVVRVWWDTTDKPPATTEFE